MNIRADDARLTAYALGELSGEELREFEVLLGRSARAREEVAAIRETGALLEQELTSANTLSARRRASILAAVNVPAETTLGNVVWAASPVNQNAGVAFPWAVNRLAKPNRIWLLLAALIPYGALPCVALSVGAARALWQVDEMRVPEDMLLAVEPLPPRPPPLLHRRSTYPKTERSPGSGTALARALEAKHERKRKSDEFEDLEEIVVTVERRPKQPIPSYDVGGAATFTTDRMMLIRAEATLAGGGASRDAQLGNVAGFRISPDDEDEVENDPEPEGASVVGGVLGGLTSPRGKSGGPKLVSAQMGHGLLAINPNQRPYKVDVPEGFVQRSETYSSVLSICVSAHGTVTSVKVLRPSIPAIDAQIPSVVRRWQYHPFLVEGQPTEFCYNVKYTMH